MVTLRSYCTTSRKKVNRQSQGAGFSIAPKSRGKIITCRLAEAVAVENVPPISLTIKTERRESPKDEQAIALAGVQVGAFPLLVNTRHTGTLTH